MPAPAWHQRLGETDSEFRAFNRWLQNLPRSAPTEPDLAIRHDWTARAQAWDVLRDVPDDPSQAFGVLVDQTLKGAIVSASMYLDQLARGMIEPDPKYPVQVINALARVQEVWQARSADAPELFDERLPTDVLLAIDEIKQLTGKVKGQ